MPCYQSTNLPSGVTTTGRTSYKTEAECNQACKEGACCEGTSCTVKPACQCQGTGQTFRGVGTVCTPSPCCGCLVSIGAKVPASATASASKGQVLTRANACNCQINNYPRFFIGIICTSAGMHVNATFIDGLSSTARLWSPPLNIAPDANCGTTVARTVNYCPVSYLGNEEVDCGSNGWPTSTTTFTRSDFADVSAWWNPTPYNSLASDAKQVFDNYFPEYVTVYPRGNPLP
jgi:hypothetical protein